MCIAVKSAGWRTLVACVAAALAVLLDASTASAAAPAPPGAKAEADRVMRLSYIDFIKYKNQRSHPYDFDFSSDGCSSGIPPPEFDQPCQQHDFGYRNYGKSSGYKLGRDEQTRLWIDNRLHQEMDRLCDNSYQGIPQQGNNQVCHYQANVAYNGVRSFGGGPFFG